MTDSLVARMIKKVEEEDLVSGTFTWRIDNFSKLKKYKHFSDVFVIGGYKWRMFIYPKGDNIDYLSVFLDVPETKTLPYGWNRYIKFTITLVDQFDTRNSVSEETEHVFMANTADWDFATLVPLSDLHCLDNGYLTTTANDMNVDACQHLQLLWEELEAFKFDLAWLEPHVQSVIAMKKKAGIVNRLQEDVDALKNEIERRRAILAEAEAVLEVAERDLAEAQEEHFSKIDMDSELGYPLS
ncbi:hypothetical protein ACFX1Q_028282 [Malus domestica]